MECGKCQKNIVDCTCPDIEERLKSLLDSAAGPAAAQALWARQQKQRLAGEKH